MCCASAGETGSRRAVCVCKKVCKIMQCKYASMQAPKQSSKQAAKAIQTRQSQAKPSKAKRTQGTSAQNQLPSKLFLKVLRLLSMCHRFQGLVECYQTLGCFWGGFPGDSLHAQHFCMGSSVPSDTTPVEVFCVWDPAFNEFICCFCVGVFAVAAGRGGQGVDISKVVRPLGHVGAAQRRADTCRAWAR